VTDEDTKRLQALRDKLAASEGMEGYGRRRAAIQAEIDRIEADAPDDG